jgi:hypothetical protein
MSRNLLEPWLRSTSSPSILIAAEKQPLLSSTYVKTGVSPFCWQIVWALDTCSPVLFWRAVGMGFIFCISTRWSSFLSWKSASVGIAAWQTASLASLLLANDSTEPTRSPSIVMAAEKQLLLGSEYAMTGVSPFSCSGAMFLEVLSDMCVRGKSEKKEGEEKR